QDDGAGAEAEGVGDNGEILEVVRATVGVAGVVGGDAVVVKINAQPYVAENRIGTNSVVDRVGVQQEHPRSSRKCNRIARTGTGAADDIIGRAELQKHIRSSVAQSVGPGRVGPDNIALNQIA